MATWDTSLSDNIRGSKAALRDAMIHAFGRSVVSWSYLEFAIDLMMEILLARHDLNSVRSAKLISSNLEVREKASLVIALAHDADMPRYDLERIIALMNKVQNALRTDRNRLFHDSWSTRDEVLMRFKSTSSRIVRPQSRKIDLFLPVTTPVEPDDLTSFLSECQSVTDEIIDLAEKTLEMPPTESPAPPPELSPLPQTLWSRFRRYWRSEPSPPPQASEA